MEQQPYVIFDYSEFPPLIQVELTGVKATDENFTVYLEEMGSVPDQAERYISILDMTKSNYLPAKYRIMQGKYLEKNKERTAQKAIAAIFVAPSFLQRTILKAIFIIKLHASPVFLLQINKKSKRKLKNS